MLIEHVPKYTLCTVLLRVCVPMDNCDVHAWRGTMIVHVLDSWTGGGLTEIWQRETECMQTRVASQPRGSPRGRRDAEVGASCTIVAGSLVAVCREHVSHPARKEVLVVQQVVFPLVHPGQLVLPTPGPRRRPRHRRPPHPAEAGEHGAIRAYRDFCCERVREEGRKRKTSTIMKQEAGGWGVRDRDHKRTLDRTKVHHELDRTQSATAGPAWHRATPRRHRGVAWRGVAWRGVDRHGVAWRGVAWHRLGVRRGRAQRSSSASAAVTDSSAAGSPP